MRGLAALFVVFAHYVAGFGAPRVVERYLSDSPAHIPWDGLAAVSLFFVLSGLVLSLRFFGPGAKGPADFSYRDYLIARIFRIWLPYLVVFAASVVAWRSSRAWTTVPEASAWFRSLWPAWGPGDGLPKEALLLDGGYTAVPQAWTLSQELSISCWVPIGALLLRAHPALLAAGVFVVVVVLDLPRFCVHFALGIVLAKAYQERARWLDRWGARRFWPLLGCGVVLYSYRYSVAPYFPRLIKEDQIWYATGLGSFLLLGCVLTSPALQGLLRRRALALLGRISYSIYLWHFGLLLGGVPPLLHAMNAAGVRSWGVAWTLGLLAITGATLGVSAASERWVEQPCIRLGRRLCAALPAARRPGPLAVLSRLGSSRREV